MEEIIVAKPDASTIGTAAVVAAFLVFAAGVTASLPIRLALIAMGAAAVYRLARMRLSVTRSKVVVVNFRRSELALDSVRIVDVDDQVAWPQDDVGERSPTAPQAWNSGRGRALYLADDSGQHVRVGVAPTYGTRLDTITEDLYRAIDAMRGSG